MTSSLPDDLWPDVQPETARRLMHAGLECFARRGYHATTTRDIAAAAGMSSGALYVYFPSKVALLFEIGRSGHEQTLALVEGAVAGNGDPVERMRGLVEEFTAWHARRHAVARVVAYELQSLPEEEYRVVVKIRRRIEQLVQGLVSEGIEAGVFQVGDVRAAVRAVLSLGIDVARWYDDRSRTSPSVLGRQYADLVLRMLGAAPDLRSPAGR
ncbi:TetR/AcrR family transcriptional regulator [Kitasatospora atroaurantiaca]|uniref:TetR family transcriptional regulator n=1 Tax=Kitasatospora atroaurantiaca TaxID=285545 RepID=A0A561F0N7_9ACTN|nr:TetR/AcrR family transcriptional regulator [Kitasatospora atroaurantiaca]TWE21430.1 TetR family transcriptional regulator [Kitasatospora atroaurantiaca]